MHPFANKFETLKRLGQMAMYGLGLAAIAWVTSYLRGPGLVAAFCGAFAVILIVPAVVFLCVMPILHWKARYRGEHSDWWGILLVLQLSGVAPLVYFFRHVLPDMRCSGRYQSDPASQSADCES